MFRITTSPAAYSNSTTRPAVITHRPSCSCMRRSRGSGMPSRIAATAADMPLSYQSFKKYAQESPGKTACHRPMAVLSPEIWGYFDNGKLHTDTITNGAGTGGTVLETHTAGYETNGIYLDGNRASDAYALNGPGSTACAGSAPSCTAAYSYDARDRLTGYTDGHGGTTSYAFDQNNSADSSIRAGNITTQTTPQGTTTSAYKGNQLTSTTTGGVTSDYWYDPLGRLTCVTTTAGTAASCNTAATGGTISPAVITANSYDFMDRFTATHSYSAGTPTSNATYSYDALDRTAQETEHHPSANITRTTTFAYEGLTNLSTQEVQQNTGAKTYDYDAYG